MILKVDLDINPHHNKDFEIEINTFISALHMNISVTFV